MPLVLTTVCFCAPKSRLFNLGYGSYGNAGAGYRENGSRVRPSSVCEPPSLATTAAHRAQIPAAPNAQMSPSRLCACHLSFCFPLPIPHFPSTWLILLASTEVALPGKPPQEQQQSVALWKERLVLSLTVLPMKPHTHISHRYQLPACQPCPVICVLHAT